jgi:hypothetical protein
MIYLNQCENSFDIGSFSFTDGYLTDGSSVQKVLGSPSGSKYYISYEVMFLKGSKKLYFFKALSTSGTCFSNYTQYQSTITLETKSNDTVRSKSTDGLVWYKVYEVFDFEEGYVEMYIDGEFFARTTSVRLEPLSSIELNLNGVAIRNLIVSDKEFPRKAELISLPIEINSEWEEKGDYYFTEDADKKITVNAKVSDDYTIFGSSVIVTGIKSGFINSLDIDGKKYDVEDKNTLSVPVEDLSHIELKGALD